MILETDTSDRGGAEILRGYELDGAYDEMFRAVDQPRKQYRLLHNLLLSLGARRTATQQTRGRSVVLQPRHHLYRVWADEGTEQIFPHDLLPRIVTSAEWSTLSSAVSRSASRLSICFSPTFITSAASSRTGVIPGEIIYTCKHFRRQMRGVKVPRDVYVSVAGN